MSRTLALGVGMGTGVVIGSMAVLTGCSSPSPTASPSTSHSPAAASRPATGTSSPATTATSTCPARLADTPALRPGEALTPGTEGTWIVLSGTGFRTGIRVEPAAAQLSRAGEAICADRPGTRVTATTTTLVDHAAWVRRAGTRSLALTPSWAARTWGDSASALVPALRGEFPELARPGMVDQLRCHVAFAPRKPVWHLEPDRPDVGYAATVAAACNPGRLVDPDGR
ncbi:DUF2599 domain-containing protein [Arsenicicoccus sp. oral taxon 190]|uniref:DUF2599 domain-containing protein n=1 Tax=Arsenicicoccus sp. oral taxon 190 TaxID=1658671 RepID=UPI0012E138C3|nr:DUF2599 domain-containing protein [Arsenicicoccus sp. oral taxon 190]